MGKLNLMDNGFYVVECWILLYFNKEYCILFCQAVQLLVDKFYFFKACFQVLLGLV